jgi:hypothetical protein
MVDDTLVLDFMKGDQFLNDAANFGVPPSHVLGGVTVKEFRNLDRKTTIRSFGGVLQVRASIFVDRFLKQLRAHNHYAEVDERNVYDFSKKVVSSSIKNAERGQLSVDQLADLVKVITKDFDLNLAGSVVSDNDLSLITAMLLSTAGGKCQILSLKHTRVRHVNDNALLPMCLETWRNLLSAVTQFVDISYTELATIDSTQFFHQLTEKEFSKLIFVTERWLDVKQDTSWHLLVPKQHRAVCLQTHKNFYAIPSLKRNRSDSDSDCC